MRQATCPSLTQMLLWLTLLRGASCYNVSLFWTQDLSYCTLRACLWGGLLSGRTLNIWPLSQMLFVLMLLILCQLIRMCILRKTKCHILSSWISTDPKGVFVSAMLMIIRRLERLSELVMDQILIHVHHNVQTNKRNGSPRLKKTWPSSLLRLRV